MDKAIRKPKVTVLMPVYNGSKYIREAIESILKQTFTDFELLIIDDGSTDDSVNIIKRYRDKRIRCIARPDHRGLIATLNEGITMAKGHYLARMDCDDISDTDRLFVQNTYLDHHRDCAVITSPVWYIDDHSRTTTKRIEGREHLSTKKIKQLLQMSNCLAHPTVMGRAAIFQHYRYATYQSHAEDYDLWLRLLADGQHIEQLAQPLLFYRVHRDSVTQHPDQRIAQRITISTKGRFVRHALYQGKINSFVLRVAWYYYKDLIWCLFYKKNNNCVS